MSTTTWPEGVIARYATLAAAVDPAATVDVIDYSEHGYLRLCCAGCERTDRVPTDGAWSDTPEETAERIATVLPAARSLAQEHAETCRALPKPDGAR